MADMIDSFITLEDLARKISVSSSTIYRWARAGKIPGVVHLGHTVRVREAAVREWLRASE